MTGGRQPKFKIDFYTIPTHIQWLLWFDEMMDVVVVLVIDVIGSILVLIDVDCSANIFIYFIIPGKIKFKKPSGTCVDVWLPVVWKTLIVVVVVVSKKNTVLLITTSL